MEIALWAEQMCLKENVKHLCLLSLSTKIQMVHPAKEAGQALVGLYIDKINILQQCGSLLAFVIFDLSIGILVLHLINCTILFLYLQ